jgi:hypothetical protein
MSGLYCKEDWSEICKRVSVVCKYIFPYVSKKAVRSAIISSVFETQTEKHFQTKGINLCCSKNDREPDLYCKELDMQCEIKVTGLDSTIVDKTITWLGGRYSKRNSDHIFIGWNYPATDGLFSDRSMSFFVLKTFVIEDDWKELSASKEYYGVGFKSFLFETKKFDMLVGDYSNKIFVMRNFE